MESLDRIKKVVERVTGQNIMKRTRQRPVVDARRIFCHLARTLTLYSLSDIGKYLKKDHATVLHNVKTAENLLKFDTGFERRYLSCLKMLPDTNNEKATYEKYKFHLQQARYYRRKLKGVNHG